MKYSRIAIVLALIGSLIWVIFNLSDSRNAADKAHKVAIEAIEENYRVQIQGLEQDLADADLLIEQAEMNLAEIEEQKQDADASVVRLTKALKGNKKLLRETLAELAKMKDVANLITVEAGQVTMSEEAAIEIVVAYKQCEGDKEYCQRKMAATLDKMTAQATRDQAEHKIEMAKVNERAEKAEAGEAIWKEMAKGVEKDKWRYRGEGIGIGSAGTIVLEAIVILAVVFGR